MKTHPILTAACLVCLIIFLVTVPLCTAATEIPRIRVCGESKLAVAPDHVVVTVRMENNAPSAKVAQDLQTKILDNTLKTLKTMGIDSQRITVSGPYMAAACSAVSVMTITSRDLDGVPALIQAVSGKPGMGVEKISYGHTQQAALVEEVRNQALLDAKASALSMTRVLGVSLGEAVFIRETESSVSDSRTGTATPDIRIQRKVEVVFRLGTCRNNRRGTDEDN